MMWEEKMEKNVYMSLTDFLISWITAPYSPLSVSYHYIGDLIIKFQFEVGILQLVIVSQPIMCIASAGSFDSHFIT